MSTFGQMKKAVAAFVKRTPTSMTIDGFDAIGNAINSARKYSERLVDFEHCRVQAKVDIGPDGADIGQITDLSGNPLSVKTIKNAFIPAEDGTPVRLKLLTRVSHLEAPTWPLALVQSGTRLYLTSRPSVPETVNLDVIRWLPDYVNDNDTDFLLQHCFDYMTLRSVEMLNLFLKEDLRIPINHQLLEQAWRTVRIWDASLLNASSDAAALD